MTRTWIGRPTADGIARGRCTVRGARHLVAATLLLALAPTVAQAQFGMLKKLKNAATKPDSAAQVKDSLDQIAAGVLPESVKVSKGSRLARGLSAANAVNNK